MNATDQSDRVVPVGRRQAVAVRPYVLRTARTLRADQQATLELVGSGFCRSISQELSSRLRLAVSASTRPAEQRTWRELLAELSDPYFATTLRWEPFAGTGLISVSLPLAVALVDRMLGGPGATAEHPHPLTEVETELVSEVARRVARCFAAALGTVVELTPDVGAYESRLGLIKVSPGSAELVVVDVEIDLGPSAGQVRIAIPAGELIGQLDAFSGTSIGAVGTIRCGGSLLDAGVDLSVRFAPALLTSEDLCLLAVGDIVTLPHPTDRPLHLWAGNRPYLQVMPGRRGPHLAVEVVDCSPGPVS